ncbi:MAG: hypothetical protein V4446_14285 [Pseudomonadota bacterium]
MAAATGAARRVGSVSARVANLVLLRYWQDIPEFWLRQLESRATGSASRVKSWLKNGG